MKKVTIFTKTKEYFVNLYSKNKKMFFAVIAVVVLILVSVPSMFFVKDKQVKETESDKKTTISYDSYASGLETKIEALLNNLNSISNVEAFVMLESSPIKHYLMELEKSQNSASGEVIKETIVFEKDGSSTKPVETYVEMPKIAGVLIVVNKIDASTKLAIINSLSVVLNVDSSCISILQEK